MIQNSRKHTGLIIDVPLAYAAGPSRLRGRAHEGIAAHSKMFPCTKRPKTENDEAYGRRDVAMLVGKRKGNEGYNFPTFSIFSPEPLEKLDEGDENEKVENFERPPSPLHEVIQKPIRCYDDFLAILQERIKPNPVNKKLTIEQQEGLISIIFSETFTKWHDIFETINDPHLTPTQNKKIHVQLFIKVVEICQELFEKYLEKIDALNTKGVFCRDANISRVKGALIAEASKSLHIHRLRQSILREYKKKACPVPSTGKSTRSEAEDLVSVLEGIVPRTLAVVPDEAYGRRDVAMLVGKRKGNEGYNFPTFSIFSPEPLEKLDEGDENEKVENFERPPSPLHEVIQKPIRCYDDFLAILQERIKPNPVNKKLTIEQQEGLISIIFSETFTKWHDIFETINDPHLTPTQNKKIHVQLFIKVVEICQELFEKYLEKIDALNTKGVFCRDANISRVKGALIAEASKSLHIHRLRQSILREYKKKACPVPSTGKSTRSEAEDLVSVLEGIVPRTPAVVPVTAQTSETGSQIHIERPIREISILEPVPEPPPTPPPAVARCTDLEFLLSENRCTKRPVLEDDEELPPVLQASTKSRPKPRAAERARVERAMSESSTASTCGELPVQPGITTTVMPNRTIVKRSDIRVSDRIPQSEMILELSPCLYNELNNEINESDIAFLDRNLFMGQEIREVYSEIYRTVEHNHLTFSSAMEAPCPSLHSGESFYNSGLLRKRNLKNRRINEQIKLQDIPPWEGSTREEWEAALNFQGSSSNMASEEVFPSQLLKVPVFSDWDNNNFKDASKTGSREGKSYTNWLQWWKSIMSGEDYLKYLSLRETDFLALVFHLYDSDDESPSLLLFLRVNLERVVVLRERREQVLSEMRAQKELFQEGYWNANSILMGGLGRDPEVDGGGDGETDDGVTIVTAVTDTETQHLPQDPSLQDRLDSVWLQLEMPDQVRIEMAIKYCNQEPAQLKRTTELWEGVCGAIVARERHILELEIFERESSDPKRLFERQAGRLREEKQRSVLHRRIKKVDKVVHSHIQKVKDKLGDVVTYQGREYKDKMSRDMTEMLYWLQQERRQTALERGDHVPPPSSQYTQSARPQPWKWKMPAEREREREGEREREREREAGREIHRLSMFINEDRHHDVIVTFKGSSTASNINCHYVVLAMHSPVLKETVDKIPVRMGKRVLTFSDLSQQDQTTTTDILLSFYTGELEITESNLPYLYQFALENRIGWIQEQVLVELHTILNEGNLLKLLHVSERCRCKRLRSEIALYLVRTRLSDYNKIMTLDQLRELSPSTILTFLTATKHLDNRPERVTLEAIVGWLVGSEVKLAYTEQMLNLIQWQRLAGSEGEVEEVTSYLTQNLLPKLDEVQEEFVTKCLLGAANYAACSNTLATAPAVLMTSRWAGIPAELAHYILSNDSLAVANELHSQYVLRVLQPAVLGHGVSVSELNEMCAVKHPPRTVAEETPGGSIVKLTLPPPKKHLRDIMREGVYTLTGICKCSYHLTTGADHCLSVTVSVTSKAAPAISIRNSQCTHCNRVALHLYYTAGTTTTRYTSLNCSPLPHLREQLQAKGGEVFVVLSGAEDRCNAVRKVTWYKTELRRVLRTLSNDNVTSLTEYEILDAALDWLDFRLPDRTYLETVLNCVRVDLLHPVYVKDVLGAHLRRQYIARPDLLKSLLKRTSKPRRGSSPPCYRQILTCPVPAPQDLEWVPWVVHILLTLCEVTRCGDELHAGTLTITLTVNVREVPALSVAVKCSKCNISLRHAYLTTSAPLPYHPGLTTASVYRLRNIFGMTLRHHGNNDVTSDDDSSEGNVEPSPRDGSLVRDKPGSFPRNLRVGQLPMETLALNIILGP
eukprot:sb/3460631/